MRGNELIRRVQKHAKAHGIRTVVRNPKDELKTGTLQAMLKQLGLSRGDI